MNKHKFPHTEFDIDVIAAQIEEKVGRTMAVSIRFPDGVDENGNGIGEGELWVTDPETGEAPEKLDGRTIAGVIRAYVHEARVTPAEARQEAIDKAKEKASAGDTAGALADVIALLEAQTATAAPE